MKFRRKSEVIEAEQYTDPASVQRIMDMIGTTGVNNTPEGLYLWSVDYGTHLLSAKGDWVAKMPDGSRRVFVGDEFASLYEPVTEPSLQDELVAALQWYVNQDDTNEFDSTNRFWLDGKIKARAVLAKVAKEKP